MQPALPSRENRRDFARLVVETARHEEANVHRVDLPGAADPGRARHDHQHGEGLMLSLGVAVPLSILPFASLMGTLLWMARP
jgi:hypothetical protein